MTLLVTTVNQGSYQKTGTVNGLNLPAGEPLVLMNGATISVSDSGVNPSLAGIATSADGARLLLMGSVLSASSFAVFSNHDKQNVMIGSTGILSGGAGGISLSNNANDPNEPSGGNFVENRGLVIAAGLLSVGISAQHSSNYIANLGTVEAVKGIVAGSAGSSNNKVVNSGTLLSSGAGVELWGNGSSLTNGYGGMIRSSGLQGQPAQAAVVLKSGVGETITVLNEGVIESYSGEEGEAVSGGAGSDRIVNSGTIRGIIRLGDGSDLYEGKGGTVIGAINMGEGDDSIYGSTFDATVDLGAGADFYDGRSGEASGSISLGSGNDTAYGGSHNDTLDGGGENDWLSGGDGNDTLYLDTGNDKGFGGSGNDLFRYTGLFGSDTIDGGSGIDGVSLYSKYDVTINLSSTKLQNIGLAGKLQLSGIENVTSDEANDLLIGSSIGNRLVALEGRDTLEGGLGNDVLDGGNGFDYARFTGSRGVTASLAKTAAQVTGYGTDTFIGIEGLLGGSGADRLTGDGEANALYGNAGKDSLSGGADSDGLYGGTGNDTLSGGADEDLLSGDIGNDRLTGGTGPDTFAFNTKLNAKTNVDVITDFVRKDDDIHLAQAIFKKLTKPVLDKSSFTIGPKAKDKDDYIIYDKTSGALYYDADGSGAGAAVKFAQFTKGTVLAYDDFYVLLPNDGVGGGGTKT
jgi:Ca2+-binding RTX toxin-like protein